MIKRLSISLLLMGLAAFSLGAAAFAFFSDSGSAGVTITAGDADLQFRVDYDCNNPAGIFDTPYFEGDGTESPPIGFEWDGIVPGDTTADCIEVFNNGDGDLTVYVKHSDFTGTNALRNDTRWQYNAQGDSDGVDCAATTPQDDQYDTGQGCELDTIGPGDSFIMRVDVEFVDDGNQNDVQEASFGFISTITGYTG